MASEAATFLGDRITIDPEICNGKPTIRGKRIAALLMDKRYDLAKVA